MDYFTIMFLQNTYLVKYILKKSNLYILNIFTYTLYISVEYIYVLI